MAFTFSDEGRSTAFAPPPSHRALPADSIGDLLPAGFLSARRSQIVGPNGTPVRIASVGLTGMNVGRWPAAIARGRSKASGPRSRRMRAMGFNCVVHWITRRSAMAQLDAFVRSEQKEEAA